MFSVLSLRTGVRRSPKAVKMVGSFMVVGPSVGNNELTISVPEQWVCRLRKLFLFLDSYINLYSRKKRGLLQALFIVGRREVVLVCSHSSTLRSIPATTTEQPIATSTRRNMQRDALCAPVLKHGIPLYLASANRSRSQLECHMTDVGQFTSATRLNRVKQCMARLSDP